MKKKTKILLIVLAIILVLAAAAAVIVLRMNRGSRTPIDNNPEPAVSGNSNVLVAYFSWSGHGQQMANWVAEETGGELFRIVPEVPYGDDFDTVADRAQTELNDGTRPALSAHIDPEIMAKFNTVYLGFPIGGTICPRRCGRSWRNMICPAKRSFRSSPMRAVRTARTA